MKKLSFENKILLICIFILVFFSSSMAIVLTNLNKPPVKKEPSNSAIKELDSDILSEGTGEIPQEKPQEEPQEEPDKEENLKSKPKSELKLEVGSKLPELKDYFNVLYDNDLNSQIKYFYNNKEVSLDAISKLKNNQRVLTKVSTYKVSISSGENTYSSVLKVVDTTIPNVELKNLTITEGDSYNIKNFVKSYSDNSGSTSYTISYKDKSQSNLKKPGTHTISIVICDQNKNCLNKTTKLTINQFVLKVVKQVTQNVVTETKAIKYGVREITEVSITYDVYNDGSKKEKSRGTAKTRVDQSTFNAKTSDMKPEAIKLYSATSTVSQTVLRLTNQYRSEVNVTSLTLDKDLSIMATIRAMELAYSGKFSHTRPNGSDWSTLWPEYHGGKVYGIMGENLAFGYSSDEAACEGWRKSKGHYENMINSNFTKMGVGKYTFNKKTYWVQLFQG